MKNKILLTIAAVAALSTSALSFSMDNNWDIFEVIQNKDKQLTKEQQLQEITRLVETENVSVNTPVKKYITPLFIACQKSNLKVIILLLQYGANITQECIKKTIEEINYCDSEVDTDKEYAKFSKVDYKENRLLTILINKNKKILNLLNATKYIDDLEPTQSSIFKAIDLIDNQFDDEIIEFLCECLYTVHDIKYYEIKKPLYLSTNTKGLKRFKDCKIITTDQDEIL